MLDCIYIVYETDSWGGVLKGTMISFIEASAAYKYVSELDQQNPSSNFEVTCCLVEDGGGWVCPGED